MLVNVLTAGFQKQMNKEKAPICYIFQFLWYKYSHQDQFQTTSVMLQNVMLSLMWKVVHILDSELVQANSNIPLVAYVSVYNVYCKQNKQVPEHLFLSFLFVFLPHW